MNKLLSKRIPLWIVALLLLASLVGTILFGGVVRHTTSGGNKAGLLGRIAVQVALIPLNLNKIMNFGPGNSATASREVGWKRITRSADWSPRRYAASVAFDGRLWLVGGSFLGGNRTNSVWSSVDGRVWTQVTAAAPWSVRSSHALVVHNGRMWILGGYGSGFEGQFYNDVWSSTDGVEWVQATASAPWSPRRYFPAISYDGKLWVLGGFDSKGELNDVWSSPDGRKWTRVLESAPWSPRAAHGAVVHNGRIWVLGGAEDNEGGIEAFNDVWYTSDGTNWVQAVARAPWAPRRTHTAVVLSDRIWIMGGRLGGKTDYFLNDVWWSKDGMSWVQATGAAKWPMRRGHTAAALNGKLWLIGGAGVGLYNDVWSLEPQRAVQGEASASDQR